MVASCRVLSKAAAERCVMKGGRGSEFTTRGWLVMVDADSYDGMNLPICSLGLAPVAHVIAAMIGTNRRHHQQHCDYHLQWMMMRV